MLSACLGAPSGTPDQRAAYYCEAAHDALVLGDDQRSVSLFRKAVEADSSSFEGYLGIASASIRRRKFADAASTLHKAKGAAAENALRWERLGNALELARSAEDAITAYEMARVLDPQEVSPLIRLGELHLSLGNDASALDACMKAVGLDPDNVSVHWALGRIHFRKGNLDSAATRMRLAIIGDPDNPEIVCDMTGVLLQIGRFEEGTERLQRVARAHPYHLRTRYLLGRSLAAANRTDEAREQSEAFKRLSLIYNEIRTFEQRAAERPGADTFSTLAHLYSSIGNDSLAQANYRRAIVLDPLATAQQEGHRIGSF